MGFDERRTDFLHQRRLQRDFDYDYFRCFYRRVFNDLETNFALYFGWISCDSNYECRPDRDFELHFRASLRIRKNGTRLSLSGDYLRNDCRFMDCLGEIFCVETKSEIR